MKKKTFLSMLLVIGFLLINSIEDAFSGGVAFSGGKFITDYEQRRQEELRKEKECDKSKKCRERKKTHCKNTCNQVYKNSDKEEKKKKIDNCIKFYCN